MDRDQETVLLIRGVIASLPVEQQRQVQIAYEEIREVERKYPDLGIVAIGLRGAELAAEAVE